MRKTSIIAALTSLVTFVVYLPALRNGFVYWDDQTYVYENPFIHSINASFFKWVFSSYYASNWHPLTWISHAIDYAAWGLDPMGHHLTNITLHALNTFIVVLLAARIIRLSGSILNERTVLISASATGLLFGLHPLHVESVAWVSERKDLLCALFFLLSILMYTKYVSSLNDQTLRRTSRFFNKQYLFTAGFFVLSLLSKPMAVTIPLVLLVLDWFPFKRIRSFKTFGNAFLDKVPFIVLSLISSVLTILAQKAGESIMPIGFAPLSTRLLVAARSLFLYLWKMILPLNLVPFYPYPKSVSLFSPEYLLPVVLFIGITIASVVFARKRKLWPAVWSYYVLTLLPVLGLVQVGDQAMADRYTYLPSLGPFLITGLMAAAIYEKLSSRRILVLKTISVLAALAALVSISYITVRQIGVWKESLGFWNFVVEKERDPFVYISLGNAYATKGLYDKAIEQYQTALTLNPDYVDAHLNLGTAYKSKGLLEAAIEQYRTALRLKPDYTEAHYNLGVGYVSAGLPDMAMTEFQTALRLNPGYANAHYNIALIFIEKGDAFMARKELEEALRIRPDFNAARRLLNISF